MSIQMVPTWFKIDQLYTTVVYKDAETGEFYCEDKIAEYLNDLCSRGFNPIWISSKTFPKNNYAIFTDSEWYFEANHNDIRQFRLPFELNDAHPTRAHPNSLGDSCLLEFSDGSHKFIVMKNYPKEDGWIKNVVDYQLPDNSLCLGISECYFVSIPTTDANNCVALCSTFNPNNNWISCIKYEAIYVNTGAILVKNGRFTDLDGANPVEGGGCTCLWRSLPLRMNGQLPSAFMISKVHERLVIYGRTVFNYSHNSLTGQTFELPSKIVECRGEFALCEDGFIYKMHSDFAIQWNEKPCALPTYKSRKLALFSLNQLKMIRGMAKTTKSYAKLVYPGRRWIPSTKNLHLSRL